MTPGSYSFFCITFPNMDILEFVWPAQAFTLRVGKGMFNTWKNDSLYEHRDGVCSLFSP